VPRSEKPIDMNRGPVATLAVALRALRDQAGRPSYRVLSGRAGYSPAVLSQAAAGRRLPSWPVVRAFVEACGGNVERWHQRWRDAAERSHRMPVEVVVSQEEETGTTDVGGTTGSYGHAEKLLNQAPEFGQPREHHPLYPSRLDADRPRRGAISVFTVDDHEIVRRGIRQVLDVEDDIEVVGEAATAAEAMAAIPVAQPRVVILDVRLPDGDGVTVCRDIRSAMTPPPACLMLTSYSDDEALFGAIMAGASGYMIKQVTGNDIVSAVRTLGLGGSLLDAGVTATVLNRLRGGRNDDPRYKSLSPQERKILDLIARGMTNRQIATELWLAEKTVKNYVSTLIHKLGFDSRTEAAVYATRLRQASRGAG
jgi:DNA-binding NarL/FixJ family response regulator